MVSPLVVLLVGSGCGGDHETVRARWDLAEPVDVRRISIDVLVGSSSCDSFKSVEVHEDDDTVRIDAKVDKYRGTGECTADAHVERTSVTLSNELGDRALTGCRPSEAGRAGAVDGDCHRTLSRGLE